MKAGDNDRRRASYIRRICQKLYGLENNALQDVEFATGWDRMPLSTPPKNIKLPETRGRPSFSGKYWDLYWMKFPDQVPDRGATPEECLNNYKDFVSAGYAYTILVSGAGFPRDTLLTTVS